MDAKPSFCSLFLLTLLLGNICIEHAQSELFTSIAHMESLLGLEMELLQTLNSYITAERKRLTLIEEFANRVSAVQYSLDQSHSSTHLYNPVNSYQLVNRFTSGWTELQSYVLMDNSLDLLGNLSAYSYRLPTQEDFSGAITAILRLQETYSLEARVIAEGELGREPSLSMSALDCYLIGRQAFDKKDWEIAEGWMEEAVRKHLEGDSSAVELSNLYEHLSYIEYSLGDFEVAAKYSRKLLQIDPTNDRALSNLLLYDELVAHNLEQFMIKNDKEEVEEESLVEDFVLDSLEKELYESLCREPMPYPPEIHSKLICYYYTADRNPRLMIRPIKVEVVYHDPKIYVFREILTEREMKRLKELGEPVLRRATTLNAKSGKLFSPVSYRIGKSGWLAPDDDELGYLAKIDQRIEDITGLSMETAEQLQVCNYGIGGHYIPHFDFSTATTDSEKLKDPILALGNRNRIATMLIYLTDVERGGATVFPAVGLRIPPTKGDAAFWWNLKKSGEGDIRTRHAGCPVLVGSKWVCNKWIHERGQEFRRPCGQFEDE